MKESAGNHGCTIYVLDDSMRSRCIPKTPRARQMNWGPGYVFLRSFKQVIARVRSCHFFATAPEQCHMLDLETSKLNEEVIA